MIGDTFGLTYNTVAKTLTKINQDNYGAVYFLDDSANLMRFTLNVKHTIPKKGGSGESHLIRLDVEHYDSDGVLIRTSSAWTVIRTDDSTQDSDASSYTTLALVGELDSTLVGQLVGRES